MNILTISAFSFAFCAGLFAAWISKTNPRKGLAEIGVYVLALASVLLGCFEIISCTRPEEVGLLKVLMTILAPITTTFLGMAIGYGCIFPKKALLFACEKDNKDKVQQKLDITGSILAWIALALGIALSAYIKAFSSITEICALGFIYAVIILIAFLVAALIGYAIMCIFSIKQH